MRMVAGKPDIGKEGSVIDRSNEEMDPLSPSDLEIDIEIELGGDQSLFLHNIIVVSDGGALIAISQQLREHQIFLTKKINAGAKCAWPIKFATGFDQWTGGGIGMLRPVDGKLCFRIIRLCVDRVGAKRKDRIFVRHQMSAGIHL